MCDKSRERRHPELDRFGMLNSKVRTGARILHDFLYVPYSNRAISGPGKPGADLAGFGTPQIGHLETTPARTERRGVQDKTIEKTTSTTTHDDDQSRNKIASTTATTKSTTSSEGRHRTSEVSRGRIRNSRFHIRRDREETDPEIVNRPLDTKNVRRWSSIVCGRRIENAKNTNGTAAAERTRNSTSGHLGTKIQITRSEDQRIRRSEDQRIRGSEDQRKLGIPKPTSGHLKKMNDQGVQRSV